MFVPRLLVQLLHWLGARIFCEEFGVQLVFSFVVGLHLAERYQVTGRYKIYIIYPLRTMVVNSPGERRGNFSNILNQL